VVLEPPAPIIDDGGDDLQEQVLEDELVQEDALPEAEGDIPGAVTEDTVTFGEWGHITMDARSRPRHPSALIFNPHLQKETTAKKKKKAPADMGACADAPVRKRGGRPEGWAGCWLGETPQDHRYVKGGNFVPVERTDKRVDTRRRCVMCPRDTNLKSHYFCTCNPGEALCLDHFMSHFYTKMRTL
jgi:hypothetical protein